MALGCCDCFGLSRKRSKGRSSVVVKTFIAKRLLTEHKHENGLPKPSRPASSNGTLTGAGLNDSNDVRSTRPTMDLRAVYSVDPEDAVRTSMVLVKETHVVVRSEVCQYPDGC